MKNIKQLITKDRTIELSDGQFFAETPKCYEIWQEKSPERILPYRVAVIRKTSVLWVIENCTKKCDHYFEEIDSNEFEVKVKCKKCDLDATIDQKWQYLHDGHVCFKEGQGE